MSVKNKIEQIKEKAAKVAVKAAAVATLMTGAGAVSSCDNQGQNGTTDENKDKIENVTEIDKADGTKTSVVFRATHFSNKYGHSHTVFLMENGDKIASGENDSFIEPGDTVTYEIGERELTGIKAVRYKGNTEVKKKVDFGKIGKIRKDRTD